MLHSISGAHALAVLYHRLPDAAVTSTGSALREAGPALSGGHCPPGAPTGHTRCSMAECTCCSSVGFERPNEHTFSRCITHLLQPTSPTLARLPVFSNSVGHPPALFGMVASAVAVTLTGHGSSGDGRGVPQGHRRVRPGPLCWQRALQVQGVWACQ
jgi:hypothetical protein